MKPYYESDGITIYHGDCRDILPTLGKVDLVLTDPPYSVSVAGAVHHGAHEGRGSRNLDFFEGDDDWAKMTRVVVEAVALASEHLEENGSLYCWCGHRQFGQIVAHLEGSGFSSRFLVWAKACPAPPPPGSGWPSGAELCVFGYRPGKHWDNAATPRSNVLVADSFRHGQPGKVDHPTQKPLDVIAPLLEVSCPRGGTVLDPFMGSGTTLVAAKRLGLKAIGIEIEKRYVDIAVKRLAQRVLDFGGPDA